jgi:hypothetical protein
LFEYEQWLKNQAGMQAAKLSWDEFTTEKKDHVTIEHIFPRLPVAGEWPTFEVRSEDERKILLHTLGNLLALSQSRNSKLSNRKFATKKQGSDGIGGYDNGSYSEIAVAKDGDRTPGRDWIPERVRERGLTMLDFLERRWQIPLGTPSDKLHLLNLEFLPPPCATGSASASEGPIGDGSLG